MDSASLPTLEELLDRVGVPAEGAGDLLRWARGRRDEILAAAPEELLRACGQGADASHVPPPPDYARAEAPLPRANVDPLYRPPAGGAPADGSGGAPAVAVKAASEEEIEELDDVEILDEEDLELLDEDEERDAGGESPGRPLPPPAEAASAGPTAEGRSSADGTEAEAPAEVNEGTETSQDAEDGGLAAAGEPAGPGGGAGKGGDGTDGVELLDEDPFDEDELDLDLSDV